ncbi:MAG: hypothetical protein D8M59_11040 [Planctomycetes bacterium]|nr:hypothetical protein [Planctomycetota bacterium]
MLILVALLGIAATMLIPSMSNVASFETEGAVRRLVADLSFAQSDAMAQQTPRRVWFESSGTGYRLLSSPFDYDTDVLYDPLALGTDGQYIVDYSNDDRWRNITVTDVSIDGGETYITYDEIGSPIAPDGTAGRGGTCRIVGEDETWEVQIAPFTGRVSATRITP